MAAYSYKFSSTYRLHTHFFDLPRSYCYDRLFQICPAWRPKAGDKLNAMDINKDGQISRDEAKDHPRLEKAFGSVDTDKDGQLSRGELKSFRELRQGQAKK